jgi:hypothetical protein
MPCLICNEDIQASIPPKSIQFAGDALSERGRYAVHSACLAARPHLRKRWVDRHMLMTTHVAKPDPAEVIGPRWHQRVRQELARLVLKAGETLGGR